ncbi:hypothetical protein [Enterobacter bugandensis]|uniref:hypothetical protein n=1 Tax=Enterobacter bugandensis TaxID=881260 RepID=UPI0031CEE90F
MSNIDKQWLQQKIASMEAARDEIPFGLDEDDSNTLAAMKLALASLEAEPIYQVWDDGRWCDYEESLWREVYDEHSANMFRIVYTAPPAPVSVPECFKRLLHHAYGMTMGHDWNKGTMAGHHRAKMCQAVDECRAAMLQGAENAESRCTIQPAPALDSLPKNAESCSSNYPVIPDGWLMVPKRLTAENGAKTALIGEFNLEYSLTCHECFGEGCDDCSGEGTWINTIPVDWSTIKDIWAKAIDHFAAAPQQEVK